MLICSLCEDKTIYAGYIIFFGYTKKRIKIFRGKDHNFYDPVFLSPSLLVGSLSFPIREYLIS